MKHQPYRARLHATGMGMLVAVGVALGVASFWAAVAADPAGDYPRVFRFGVLKLLAGVNSKDAQVIIEMNIINNNKAEFPDISAKLELLQDVDTASTMFKQRRLHAIALSSTDFLALREHTSLTPLFISSQQSSPLEAYLLLTQRRVTRLEDLLNQPRRRLVLEDYGQTHVGQMWLDTYLQDRGFTGSEQFFSVVRRADKPARLVLPVFFGQAEACLVPESVYHTMVELNPQIGQRLRVLMRSPGFVRSITCARQDLNERLVDAMKRNALDLTRTVGGQQLMLIFRYKRHYSYRSDLMQDTVQVYRKYQSATARR